MSEIGGLNGALEHRIMENERLRDLVFVLWLIIDDIDTYSDVVKGDDAAYRRLVESRQKDRWKTGVASDGYTLDFSAALKPHNDLDDGQPTGCASPS